MNHEYLDATSSVQSGFNRVKAVIESCETIGQWYSSQNYMTLAIKTDFVQIHQLPELMIIMDNQLKLINT